MKKNSKAWPVIAIFSLVTSAITMYLFTIFSGTPAVISIFLCSASMVAFIASINMTFRDKKGTILSLISNDHNNNHMAAA